MMSASENTGTRALEIRLPVALPTWNALLAMNPWERKKGARFSAPVCINILSYRRKLADADGVSAKAVIDGLRYCGILQDDTTRQISEIRYKQAVCKAEEYTLITVTPEGTDA